MNKLFKKLGIIIFTAIIAVGFFSLSNVGIAQAAESITDFNADITINKDSSLNVIETITYDFGSAEKHGIYRNIPYKYKAQGGNFTLRISDLAVVDENKNDYAYTTSHSGGDLVLKIGDANKTVTGIHIYKISYSVRRAINYFSDHDELYWNSIGSAWEVPIQKATTIVRAPVEISKVTCYTGPEGSTAQNCSISGGNTKIVTFNITKPLDSGDGLTIVAGMPANSLDRPTTLQKLWDIFTDNGILLLPIFVFGIMYFLWNKYGKDPKRKNSIVAQYEAPDKLSAMYMGTLLHNKTTNKDISAEVIFLAANGYLSIRRFDTTKLLVFKGVDYEFTKLDKSTVGLAPQTAKLLNELFSGNVITIKLSDLKIDRTFGTALVKIKSDVVKELVKSGFYKFNPMVTKGLWFGLGILLSIGGSILLGNAIGYLGVIAAIVSGIIIIVFSLIMPARTQKGTDAVANIKGLELYLTVAEKDRLNFHNAPEKNPQHFEMLLPFAVALGVETAWAAQFKDLSQAPSWYSDSNGGTFNALVFTNSIGHFSDSVQSAASSVTTSSSGGSGFGGGGVGGGGGGGGGGSW